tara:strand:- start:828 stop:1292 length:465 start_codon:yes stop_codon:yes gene_type:complete
MIKVNVVLNNIFWKRYIKNPQNFFEKKIKLLNKKSKSYKKKTLIFSLLLSGTKDIIKLNKKFRNKNKSTDILSFPFYKKDKLKNKINNEKEIYIGDIIINLSKIKNKDNLKRFQEELNKLWIHGLVHLFGYKHKKEKDFILMDKVEKRYLGYIR